MKELIHKLHLILGLGSGVVVLIVALTGCVWAFEEEIRYVTQRDQLYVTPQTVSRVPVSRVLEVVRQTYPTVSVSQVRFFGDPSRAVQVFTKEKRLLTVNPYSGKLLANRDQENDWLLINLKLHRTLLLGDAGKEIIYWNAWLFGVMLLTGFILWLPARLRQLRASLTVKWSAKRAKRTYDLHSVLGFYAIPFLLLMVATGIDMASHGGEKEGKPVVYQQFADGYVADQAVASVLGNETFEVIRVSLPKDSLNPLRVTITYPTSGLRKESTFAFDPVTARLLEANRHEEQSFGDRFWKSDYELHTGRILGLFGKILAFVVGLIAASLPVTGCLIWWNRRQKARLKGTPPRKRRFARV